MKLFAVLAGFLVVAVVNAHEVSLADQSECIVHEVKRVLSHTEFDGFHVNPAKVNTGYMGVSVPQHMRFSFQVADLQTNRTYFGYMALADGVRENWKYDPQLRRSVRLQSTCFLNTHDIYYNLPALYLEDVNGTKVFEIMGEKRSSNRN